MSGEGSKEELRPLAQFCKAKGLEWDSQREERFGLYLELLVKFNEAMNLIGPMGREEVVETLLLDSIVAAAARAPRGPILDVGTGAGLPGIPLKILYPELPIALVEPRQKRSNFLKLATHRLGFEEVELARCRIEDFEGRDFDTVISKAFEAPTKWLRTAYPRLREPGGAVLCMARRKDLVELEEVARELRLERVGAAEAPRATQAEDGEDRVVYAFQR